MHDRVLIAGVSTRAAAESAARAGFAVTALDAFGDLDQHPSVRALSLPRDFGARFTPQAAARVAATIECDAVAYLASFENHPGAVEELMERRALWGNPPAVLRRVRDPLLLSRALCRRGHPSPAIFGDAGDDVPTRQWLVKPLASGGGFGVRSWDSTRTRSVPHGCYVQERIAGTPGSIVFVSARGRAVPLGISRQLIGEDAFGATGYRYCGSILTAAADRLAQSAHALATAVAGEFGLVGVNGIDFVVREEIPYAVEVNPRWCASMELVERAYGLSVFGAHAAACEKGELPAFDHRHARPGAAALGKAIVFSRDDIAVGDTRAWLSDPDIRDVPQPGEQISGGHPICTVFAAGNDVASCHAALVRRAGRVYAVTRML